MSSTIDNRYISRVFEKLNWGIIHGINIINKPNHCCVFITLKWHHTKDIQRVRTMLDTSYISVVYNHYTIIKIFPRKDTGR